MDYLLGRTPKKPEQKGFVAKYLCIPCDSLFLANPSLGKGVACPRCRGTRCEAKSPAVRVMNASTVLTPRDVKRLKFKQRSDKMVRQLQEQRNSFVAFLKLLEVPESLRSDAAQAMDKALEVAKKVAEEKQARY